jgi:hypothetical protein
VLILVTQSMGTLSGLFVPQWFDESPQPKPLVTGALIGNLGGAAAGMLLWRDRNYTFGQGVFIGASAAVGAAVGVGVPLIAQADKAMSYQIAGTVGGWGGLVLGEWLSHSLFERSARDARASANITVPALWQLPGLLTSAAINKRTGRSDAVYQVGLLDARF